MNSTDIPKAAEGTRSELLDDELLLYFEEETRIVALNPSATLIWSLCDGKRSLGEIEKLLSDAYPDAADRIPGEIEEAIQELVDGGALEITEVA